MRKKVPEFIKADSNKKREMILKTISNNPGTSYTHLAKLLGLGDKYKGHAYYHIQKLIDAGKIRQELIKVDYQVLEVRKLYINAI